MKNYLNKHMYVSLLQNVKKTYIHMQSYEFKLYQTWKNWKKSHGRIPTSGAAHM